MVVKYSVSFVPGQTTMSIEQTPSTTQRFSSHIRKFNFTHTTRVALSCGTTHMISRSNSHSHMLGKRKRRGLGYFPWKSEQFLNFYDAINKCYHATNCLLRVRGNSNACNVHKKCFAPSLYSLKLLRWLC